MTEPTDDQVRAQYRDGSNLNARIALHARFSTATQDWHGWMMGIAQPPPGARILEVGCGTGALWGEVRAHVAPGWRLTLTDLSAGMLSEARGHLAEWGLAARYARCDAQALPFAGGAFDVVLANHMLYHVPDLARGIAEIARVLAPDGVLYAATNGAGHMRELDELAREAGLPGFKSRLSFRLENGAESLAPYFARVERHDFPDSLAVTEVEPLVAYIASMDTAGGQLTPERAARMRAAIAARLRRDGVIRIQKATGLFRARKAT